ncbi:MAG: hypothetical protein OEZ38_06025 [Gammaproteobacteria bacterium]|nr:hypothetical protein [Gammaproteobacteria bacterium]
MSQAHFSLTCKRCNSQLELDDFAIDTQTCQNKHVFFFKCPGCDDFSATAMANIPQEQWYEFVPADKLDNLILAYDSAMKKHG